MSKKYDLIIFIGRFQPFHLGHKQVIDAALKLTDNVAVLIGSPNQPRTSKNPWTYTERETMIKSQFDDRVVAYPLPDQRYNDQVWAAQVQRIANDACPAPTVRPNIAIIGHSKDESSYYLKMFPQWDLIEHPLDERINATDIRGILFEGLSLNFLTGVVPTQVKDAIQYFQQSSDYEVLQREYNLIKAYKKAWEAAPYPPTFVTVDALVIQSGHILLVERDAAPGEGLLAIPGGFLNQNEWIVDGMIRELREETRLKVPAPVLKGSIKKQQVFDDPNRSQRGRTITHAFLIELPPGELPVVKGGDDARTANWYPIGSLSESLFFEDHWHIIQTMING